VSLFRELKRRNIFKVAAAYIIVGWLLLQVSDVLVPALYLPDWFHSGIAFLLILGFPVAMIFAWAFELTPEGLKRDHEVDRSQSITQQTSRKLDFIIIGLLIAALGYFAWDKFVLAPERKTELVEATTAVVEQTAEIDKSIAVLPFVNMSSDTEQEYFSDGLTEEVLNLLAKIPNLRVIARTSSFAYKGKDVKIAEVANELHVGHVLEGSVRKAGNQLRITAQLIRASDSSHLWSETYDRTLENIFAIQDEIAAAVVSQLKLELLGETLGSKQVDPAAYALFLQAQQVRRQYTAEAYEQAVELYRRAVEIEPNYAAAWVGLSNAYGIQKTNGFLPFDEGRRLQREAAERALLIDPDFALVYARLAESLPYNELAKSTRYYQRALELEPTNPDILTGVGGILRALGRFEEAIALTKYQIARDPVSTNAYSHLGYYYLWSGRLDDAIAAFRTALRLAPGRIVSHYRIGEALLLKGEPEAALAEMQQEPDEGWRLIGLSLVHHALGQGTESNVALDRLIMKFEESTAYNIAYVCAFRGEADRAFEWLDKADKYHDTGLSQINVEALFRNIHDDPRWLPFLERVGRSPEQLATIKFEVNLPQ
jgi:TolB-like protein/Tfp pilus assembly protein PilF